jgi:hypothetical protein
MFNVLRSKLVLSAKLIMILTVNKAVRLSLIIQIHNPKFSHSEPNSKFIIHNS